MTIDTKGGATCAEATVARYLKTRLEQLGLNRMFGVAGNYTAALLDKRPRAVLWAGVELQHFGLQDAFLALLDAANRHSGREDPVRFVTTASSKSVLSEDHPLFDGCVTLRSNEIRKLVGDEGVLIGLGGWTTSKNTGSENIRGPGTILAANGNVMIGAEFFPQIDLASYVAGLTERFQSTPATRSGGSLALTGLSLPESMKARRPTRSASASAARTTALIRYDDFFAQLDLWLGAQDILVVDAGFPLIGAQGVHIAARNGFVAQAAWLAIGYSVAAATGVKCANPQQRAVVVVGDGAFHETCQAVSDHHSYGHNTVVFVISNGLYGIEQFIVNPNPFRKPPNDYRDHPLQNSPYAYNRLPRWDFKALAAGFGGIGRAVSTPDELQAVLGEIRATPEQNFVVEVRVPETSIPRGLDAELAGTGEDETASPNWPPAGKF